MPTAQQRQWMQQHIGAVSAVEPPHAPPLHKTDYQWTAPGEWFA
jgi:hypothetical protein